MWALYIIDDLKLLGVDRSAVPLATFSTVLAAYWSLPARPNSRFGFATIGLLTGVYTILIFAILFTVQSTGTDIVRSGFEFPTLTDQGFIMNFLVGVLYIFLLVFILMFYVVMTAIMILMFTFGTCILIPIALAWLFWPLEKKAKTPPAPPSRIG